MAKVATAAADDGDFEWLRRELEARRKRAEDLGEYVADAESYALAIETLRRIAEARLRGQQGTPTLGVTALVNELYLKLFQGGPIAFKDRDHFLALASLAMRQILTDHARRRNRQKRAAPGPRVPLDDLVDSHEANSGDLELLDTALIELAKVDPRAAKAVELRFFGGCSMKEIARILRVGLRTIERDIAFALAWLRGWLGGWFRDSA